MFFNEWITSGALVGAFLVFSLALGYSARNLRRGVAPQSRGRTELYPVVEIQQEGGIFLFNLAISNNYSEDVWAENCDVCLSDCDGESSHGFESSFKGSLAVRTFVSAGEMLRVGLSQTVYEAAGRPQGEYSFVISGMLKYHIEDCCYQQAFRSRQVKMFDLDPIEVRKVRRPDKKSLLNDKSTILPDVARH